MTAPLDKIPAIDKIILKNIASNFPEGRLEETNVRKALSSILAQENKNQKPAETGAAHLLQRVKATVKKLAKVDYEKGSKDILALLKLVESQCDALLYANLKKKQGSASYNSLNEHLSDLSVFLMDLATRWEYKLVEKEQWNLCRGKIQACFFKRLSALSS